MFHTAIATAAASVLTGTSNNIPAETDPHGGVCVCMCMNENEKLMGVVIRKRKQLGALHKCYFTVAVANISQHKEKNVLDEN